MAINTITYSDKSDLATTATPSANKVSASDMNEIKSVVNNNANLMYQVGELFYSTSSTNPSTTLGGTWSTVNTNEVVDKGYLETSTGISLNYGEYRVFSNGDYEAWGYFATTSVNANTTINATVTLPFTTIASCIMSNLAYGGSNWGNIRTSSYCGGGSDTINISIINTGGSQAESLIINFYAKGTLNLENNNYNAIYCFKRTA